MACKSSRFCTIDQVFHAIFDLECFECLTGRTFVAFLSVNLHPSPSPACAQLPPFTLKTCPNWPKYAPFTFPKDLRTFCGETFFAILGPQIGHFGGTPPAAKTAQNWSKKIHKVKLLEALSGSKRVQKCLRKPSQRVQNQFWAKLHLTIFGPNIGHFGGLVQGAALEACPPPPP